MVESSAADEQKEHRRAQRLHTKKPSSHVREISNERMGREPVFSRLKRSPRGTTQLVTCYNAPSSRHCNETVVTTHLWFQALAWEPLHPSYLSRGGRLSSDSRSRRGSEAARHFRTCTNHRIASGRPASYYLRSTRASFYTIVLIEIFFSQ